MNLQTIERTMPDVSQNPKMDIAALIETNLPPSPKNIMRLSTLLRDINTPPRKIAEAVTSEPLLFTRVLRLANSPIYALERKTTSIPAAISVIGNTALQEIVMIGLASATFSRDAAGLVAPDKIWQNSLASEIWEHSLAVAIIARELSAMLKMRGTEEAFTCGLLHDLGKLIFLNHDFQTFLKIMDIKDEDQMLAAEVEQFGYDHAEIGSVIAERWGLQDEVSIAIRFHHQPSRLPCPMQVAYVIEAADIIANIKGYGWRAVDKSKLMQSDSAAKLQFTEKDFDDIWEKVENSIAEVIRTFNN